MCGQQGSIQVIHKTRNPQTRRKTNAYLQKTPISGIDTRDQNNKKRSTKLDRQQAEYIVQRASTGIYLDKRDRQQGSSLIEIDKPWMRKKRPTQEEDRQQLSAKRHRHIDTTRE